MAELIMLLLAFAAQMESQATAERVTGSRAAGTAYGYRAVPNPEGKGVVLEPDPEAIKVLEKIAERLLDGATPNAVARELNAEGIATPKTHYDRSKGRTPKVDARWAGVDVKRVVSSPVLGHQTYRGATVRDGAGRPVLAADPVVTRETYDKVKAALAVLAKPERRQRSDTRTLPLGVAHCSGCGRRMYRVTSAAGQAHVYSCPTRSTGHHCPAPASMKAAWADDYAQREFLRVMGGLPVTRVVEVDGYDPGPELAEVTAELSGLIARQREVSSAATRAVWAEEIAKLEARAAELEATPKTEPRRETISTGERGAQLWERSDLDGRRRMLLDAGTVVMVRPVRKNGGRVGGPDETRLVFAVGAADPAGDALCAIEWEEAA